MKQKAVLFFIFFWTVLMLFIDCGPQKSGWQGTIEEVDGVTFVKNPKQGLWDSRENADLTITKERQIGELEHPTVSADGNRIYFHSYRPKPHEERFGEYHIWYVEKKHDGWGAPEKLEAPINTDKSSWNPFLAHDGYLYFSTDRSGGYGDGDIYRAKLADDQFIDLENLGNNINTRHNEYSPCVNLSGRHILFSRYMEEPKGVELYVSFYLMDGSWSQAEKAGHLLSIAKRARFPGLSHDEKYLFFNAFVNRDVEIYWVDARIIEDLKPGELK